MVWKSLLECSQSYLLAIIKVVFFVVVTFRADIAPQRSNSPVSQLSLLPPLRTKQCLSSSQIDTWM